MTSVNGVQIVKGETLIRMSRKKIEDNAPQTLSVASPKSSVASPKNQMKEQEKVIQPEVSRRAIEKHASGTLLNTDMLNAEAAMNSRTNTQLFNPLFLPNIEVTRTGDKRRRETTDDQIQSTIQGLKNLKNSETGLKSVVFSTSFRSIHSGTAKPEAFPEGLKNFQILKAHE